LRSTAILFCALLFTSPAGAATCGGDFSAFLSAMSREAAAAGISRTVIDSAFAGLTPDGAVLAFDRRQRGTFRKSFEDYAATRVVPARINRARQLMKPRSRPASQGCRSGCMARAIHLTQIDDTGTVVRGRQTDPVRLSGQPSNLGVDSFRTCRRVLPGVGHRISSRLAVVSA
jgi:hypothetical protein